MVIKKINATPVVNLQNKRVNTCNDLIKKEALNVVSEIDFVTCGIKPRGGLFLRASKLLLNSKELKAKLYRRKNLLLKAAFGLIQGWVSCQENVFKPNRFSAEDWLTRKSVLTLMNGVYMQRSLQKAFEFRDKIEESADDSELFAVALKIIHEYETFCSHIKEINKHIEVERRKIDLNRKKLHIVLEKRDGLFCKNCMSVENLQIDHKIPLTLGGYSNIENLQLLCHSCNSRKSNRP